MQISTFYFLTFTYSCLFNLIVSPSLRQSYQSKELEQNQDYQKAKKSRDFHEAAEKKAVEKGNAAEYIVEHTSNPIKKVFFSCKAKVCENTVTKHFQAGAKAKAKVVQMERTAGVQH